MCEACFKYEKPRVEDAMKRCISIMVEFAKLKKVNKQYVGANRRMLKELRHQTDGRGQLKDGSR